VTYRATSRFLFVSGALALLVMAGCAGGPRGEVPEVSYTTSGETTAPGYGLRVGDELYVRFLTAPGMDYKTPVTPSGTVILPTGDEVEAVGLTVRELSARVEETMSEHLLDPSVSITIEAIDKQPVFVIGEVKRPGEVEYYGRMTVVGALSYAGGMLPSGKPSSVMVIRTAGVPEPAAFRVDVSKVLSGRDLSQDMELRPDDIVYVPQSVIGKIDEFVDLFFAKIAPAQVFYLRGHGMLGDSGETMW
jgi:polysaccharide export outer membrane protein